MIRISIQSDIPAIPSLQPCLLESRQQLRPRNVVGRHHALRRVCLHEERVRGSVEVEQEAAAGSRRQRWSEARRDKEAAAADRERHVAAVVKHDDVRDHG